MSATILIWIGVGGFIFLLFGWQYLAKLIPASKTTAVIDKAEDYADEAVAWAALKSAAVLFRKHGNTAAAATLAGLTAEVMRWDDPPVTPDGQG
jgi:hypothetical protein